MVASIKITLSSFAIIWTIAAIFSCSWSIYHHNESVHQAALGHAKISLKKDVIYRKWNASHVGGVYVPITDETQPNPYLDLPDRDITTTTGLKLTRINPAYMTRQINEITHEYGEERAQLSSLQPKNPKNIADIWEKKALQTFIKNRNIKSIEEIVNSCGECDDDLNCKTHIHEEKYLRYIEPFVTVKSCLPCHGKENKEGDIRGAVSIAVPMKNYYAITEFFNITSIVIHSLLWLGGIFGVCYGMKMHMYLSAKQNSLMYLDLVNKQSEITEQRLNNK